ncbi:hypothetical protein BH23PLA1_BH23PLA1_02380 [soil metagenome]
MTTDDKHCPVERDIGALIQSHETNGHLNVPLTGSLDENARSGKNEFVIGAQGFVEIEIL